MSVCVRVCVTKAVGTCWRLGGVKKICAQFLYHTYISKRYNFVHWYIFDFQYLLSYEPILALFLYTLIYMSLFLNSLLFWFAKYWGWGWGNLPPLFPRP